MTEIESVEELLKLLRKRATEYIICGSINERIKYLYSQCMDNKDQVFHYLGGPIFWISHWRATKKEDQRLGISKTERNIITILQNYELCVEKKCLILTEKMNTSEDEL
jgi:hypothetical protein